MFVFELPSSGVVNWVQVNQGTMNVGVHELYEVLLPSVGAMLPLISRSNYVLATCADMMCSLAHLL